MIEQDKKIRKGLTPRRDEACLRVERDIVIPAGTILRQEQLNTFEAQVGSNGTFAIFVGSGTSVPDGFKRVVA